MEEAILFDSVAELGRMLRSREISPLELTAAYIDHAKTGDVPPDVEFWVAAAPWPA